jgi:hypothetical protein
VKLVHEHFGLSELTHEFLETKPLLDVKVQRDATCDETFKSFKEQAPRVIDESGPTPEETRIVFIGELDSESARLQPTQLLPCYRVMKSPRGASPFMQQQR